MKLSEKVEVHRLSYRALTARLSRWMENIGFCCGFHSQIRALAISTEIARNKR